MYHLVYCVCSVTQNEKKALRTLFGLNWIICARKIFHRAVWFPFTKSVWKKSDLLISSWFICLHFGSWKPATEHKQEANTPPCLSVFWHRSIHHVISRLHCKPGSSGTDSHWLKMAQVSYNPVHPDGLIFNSVLVIPHEPGTLKELRNF